MISHSPITARLNHWSGIHALWMLATFVPALAGFPLPLAVAGVASFLWLLVSMRETWTPQGRFGYANGLTLLRLLGALCLLTAAARAGSWPALLVLLMLLADGVDGWLARRQGWSSEFGDRFDQEVDAFSFLALCLLVYWREDVGLWAALPGMLRYGFVLYLKWAGPPLREVRGNWFTRSISIIAILAYLLCLSPLAGECTVPALAAAFGLCASFLYSGWEARRPDYAPLHTTRIAAPEDVRAFFDRLAPLYRDCHGKAEALLHYRLRLVERLLNGAGRGLLVEIGCGTGLHLFPLSRQFQYAHGTDLSPEMIRQAERLRCGQPNAECIALSVAPAEALDGIESGQADAVLCVGAFEHMHDRPRVLREVRRILRAGGVFVCLTPNGGWLWYARWAGWLGLNTRHLSSDHFLDAGELRRMLEEAGLEPDGIGYWSFIPRGDLPPGCAWVLAGLDRLGRWFGIGCLRGGLYCRANKPAA